MCFQWLLAISYIQLPLLLLPSTPMYKVHWFCSLLLGCITKDLLKPCNKALPVRHVLLFVLCKLRHQGQSLTAAVLVQDVSSIGCYLWDITLLFAQQQDNSELAGLLSQLQVGVSAVFSVLCCAVLCCAVLCFAVLYCAALCRAVLGHAAFAHYAVQNSVMACCGEPCHGMQYHAMPCCAVPY